MDVEGTDVAEEDSEGCVLKESETPAEEDSEGATQEDSKSGPEGV